MKRNVKICSACLLGISCRYDGKIKSNEKVIELSKREILIPICPEQLGGQCTPRLNSEIKYGEGIDVINGKAKVLEEDNTDVTSYFIAGANESFKLAQMFDVKEAIMKQRSPSCGCGQIYDGSFSGKIRKGDGVTVALFKKNGIKVITEEDL